LSPFDVLKSILETVPPYYREPWEDVNPREERILRKLTESEVKTHEEVCGLDADLRASLCSSLRLMKLFEAKQFLFIDSIRLSDERAETAEGRGKHIGFRRAPDGTRVLVEIRQA